MSWWVRLSDGNSIRLSASTLRLGPRQRITRFSFYDCNGGGLVFQCDSYDRAVREALLRGYVEMPVTTMCSASASSTGRRCERPAVRLRARLGGWLPVCSTHARGTMCAARDARPLRRSEAAPATSATPASTND